MAVDLSRFSTPDLEALRKGDLSKVSDNGLRQLKQMQAGEQPQAKDVLSTATPASDVGLVEEIAGHPATRFALGAAAPFLGAYQLGAHAIGTERHAKAVDEHLRQLEEAKRRGMAARGESLDIAGTAGNILSPVGLGVGKLLSSAPKVVGGVAQKVPMSVRASQGAGIGAVYGATAPVTEPKDFLREKATQTGAGVVLGAASAPIGSVLSSVGNLVRPVYDLFSGKKGASNILQRSYERIVGSDRMKAVSDVLKSYVSPLESQGYKPTAAEAVSGTPAGSPVQALQKMTAKTPGGPSAEFGERIASNLKAIEQATTLRNAVTAPLRERALELANKGGGVPTPKILGEIFDLAQTPELKTNPVVQKTLTDIRNYISEGAGEKLRLDADSLYTIRKLIGNTIRAHSREAASWDKKLAGGLERDVQKIIDSGIEQEIKKAGGTGKEWSSYLEEFSKRSDEIAQTLERQDAALKPEQITQLMGAHDLTSNLVPKVALLSRPVVIANAILGYMGKQSTEPLVDELNTRLLLNPKLLGEFLDPARIANASRDFLNRSRTVSIGATTLGAGRALTQTGAVPEE